MVSMNRILALPRVTRLAKRSDFSAVCSARNARGQQTTSAIPSKEEPRRGLPISTRRATAHRPKTSLRANPVRTTSDNRHRFQPRRFLSRARCSLMHCNKQAPVRRPPQRRRAVVMRWWCSAPLRFRDRSPFELGGNSTGRSLRATPLMILSTWYAPRREHPRRSRS
jgi:hypothetical protein